MVSCPICARMNKQEQVTEPILADMAWFTKLTGWDHHKVSRLARQGRIPGAFKTSPGTRGERWSFRKSSVMKWLDGLEVK
jgi:hypothetical protein